jgi:hypothetical protein
MGRIFKAAKAHGFEVFISLHYFYPTDKGWKFNGPLEPDEVSSGMFARKGVLNLEGLEGSGADWLERFKPYIQDGKTIVATPHCVFGPETSSSTANSARCSFPLAIRVQHRVRGEDLVCGSAAP